MRKYLETCEVECDYRYTYWDVVTGDLKERTPADTLDFNLDYVIADNHAYLTMRTNCEKEPHTLIRLSFLVIDYKMY